ncbi:MAG: hypothetical protein J6R59_02435 [Paludibacteraceae bacterium]|nr:hypothetical protein [Paludibacteraceae bacterium]
MDNMTDKDIETLRLVTEIRKTAENLRSLSMEWEKHTGSDWRVRQNTYQGACCEIINDMERIFIKKFGLIPNEIYPEYDEPVDKLEVGKSYWAWVRHRDGAASYDIEVVSREGEKIYARLRGFGEELIAVGTVNVQTGGLKDGSKATAYEQAYFTWATDYGYEFYGDIAGWDKVED